MKCFPALLVDLDLVDCDDGDDGDGAMCASVRMQKYCDYQYDTFWS